ncbi:hypothetical protein F53441_12593 [Fusarium austroafricanum]|uniref:Heterokaryon incompatibility domain-containing protein n=1 Tax=Fusarium austroafricanum TaxID=2364996 RepID=A0A8H4NPI7_9HYPO|nr:hypothetical protein F53441_12593 [Fusarium austroafricanum]
MPTLRRVVTKSIRDHHTTTTIDKIFREKNGESVEQSPDTAAMVREWERITQKKGEKSVEENKNATKKRTHDVDGMTDEELGLISIHIATESEDSEESSVDDKTRRKLETEKFDEYKHHQYLHRWGLFKDSDGRDEEWFIPDSPVFEESDPEYLCNMCRHIDFKVLFSQRGLLGNQMPGQPRISMFGVPTVMDESSHCAFCRLLRKQIVQDEMLSNTDPDDWEGMKISLNPLDDGPEYALRLEVDLSDVDRFKYSRFVINMVDQESAQPPPLQGLVVRRDAADMLRLRGWLHTCNESHKSPSDGDSTTYLKPLTSTIRVIDTVENCVKEVDTPCEYICLSYVWGTGSQTQYTTKTRDQLSTPGGLENAELPQTILDAIKVTRELGVRYIWIDALCITQDDDDDKAKIISNMGTIYANAMLSIMASTNINPTDGLPGVGVLRSQEQNIEKLQGLTLAVAFQDPRQMYSNIEDRLWNTRAWTFQERVLSRRSVYFTDSQMCFVCPHGAAFEDTVQVPDPNYTITPANNQLQLTSGVHHLWTHIWTDPTQAQYINKAFQTEDDMIIFVGEDPATGEPSEDGSPLYKYKAIANSDTIDAPLIKGDTLWEVYAHAVSAYTKRDMTWQSDAVNAFVGIADLIGRGTNTTFWHAMPEFDFARSLLWYPQEPMTRRRSPDGKALFPSWSWAAWQGHVTRISVEQSVQIFSEKAERTQEEIERHRRRAESARVLASQLSQDECWSLYHNDYRENGWKIEHDKARNQHIYSHDAYPGVRVEYPISLPGENILEIPQQDILIFNVKAVLVRLCEKPHSSFLQSPIRDNFLQIGVNDEDRSANYRRPWQRIVYHQGYRAGILTLNVPLEVLDIPTTAEESEESDIKYTLVAISRDGLGMIAPPPFGSDTYWRNDPVRIQWEMLEYEWALKHASSTVPDENVKPTEDKVNEMTGDPRWDQGRFGPPVVLDVCNVLLLRESSTGISERVGVGKINYSAFCAAKPEVDVCLLK